jgi:fido (protein-threonine AMPylation protein)
MTATYNREQEPDSKTKSYNWKTAIGLQKVDGLCPTEYLIDLANQNIKGDISLEDVRSKIHDYYNARPTKTKEEQEQKEADIVSQRIAELLVERAFTLSKIELLAIHKHLFTELYDFAGKIRDFNISKNEYILGGRSVEYGNARIIDDMIEHDLSKEKSFNYAGLDEQRRIEHIAKFISDLWQIHPFAEGNTRTTAVFTIKYLRTFGYEINNDVFEQHSWFFRNALVRANYKNVQLNITETVTPLINFFENLLTGKNHELKNRELKIIE